MGVHFALPDSDLQSICFQGKHLCFCAQWQCKDWRTRKRLNKRRTKNRDSSAVSVSARSLIVIRTHQKLNGFVTVTVTSRAFAFNWSISAVDSIAVSVLPTLSRTVTMRMQGLKNKEETEQDKQKQRQLCCLSFRSFFITIRPWSQNLKLHCIMQSAWRSTSDEKATAVRMQSVHRRHRCTSDVFTDG